MSANFWKDGNLMVRCPKCKHTWRAWSWLLAHAHMLVKGTCVLCGTVFSVGAIKAPTEKTVRARRVLGLLLVLAACGPGFDPVVCAGVHDYRATSFESMHEGQCARLRSRVDLSRRLLVDSGVSSDTELTALRGRSWLDVHEGNDWVTPDGVVEGRAAVGRVEVNASMLSLAHEEIHMIEFSNGLYVPDHGAWNARGWHALADFYAFVAEPGPHCRGQDMRPEHAARLRVLGWPVTEWGQTPRCR